MHDFFHQVTRLPDASGPRDPRHPGWPEASPKVALNDGRCLRLRPLTWRDGGEWARQRRADESWLRPVEPTQRGGWHRAHERDAWQANFSFLRTAAKKGTVVPLVIDIDGRFAGQVTIGNIQHGALSEAWIGYWVHSPYMGAGVATAACALGVDHAFERIGLHRLTATYLPTNPASGRVLAKCGFHNEGFLRANLHIDGRWRDHHFVALLADEYASTCVARQIEAGRCAAWHEGRPRAGRYTIHES
ncbi:GNAT family N-acetyltransferase [Corynebacterium uterequi]|uniref:Acetyltransferase, ribosomal protein N-acetylase n=1 Tax=Corynebacterium uterequi TaxID=1072256 RepID=A0A0G3HDD8_9CORY|nr:GNAT family protein [Corynebacterium uterequi]AKK10705.1 acetyltransferase, ribosomal protein N-acetylase [Corynebacterium uterequi]